MLTPTHPLRATLLIALVLALLACGHEALLVPDGSMLTGVWNGNGMRLVATSEGARMGIGCAAGWTTEALRVDAQGRFVSPGWWVDFIAVDSVPATWAGLRSGESLTILRIVGADTSRPLALTRGGPNTQWCD